MRGLGEFNIYRMAVMRGGKGGMLVVWNGWLSGYHHIFWALSLLILGLWDAGFIGP